ncbi:oxidoreductase [Mycobacterium sp. 852002-30065_SCH5024008]|uniref:oxidoreductase n=1 Tax=Mycobacterium sp. 852002-30065_SCH5024008 TaxID=1834088 RepID=UPI0007FFA897|nr:oxidoreductase [Mycobacterium sp. 852002-30065_SCH5024008]OBB84132.1 oxidoreductase [Mycobacterium sp. 852002-30065_SCH5024008]
MVNVVPRRSISIWRSIVTSPVLTLNGWVAFNLPRTVTALGGSLLVGLVAVHAYVWIREPGVPWSFAVYSALLAVCCLTAAAAMMFAFKPRVPQAGWYLGSLVCLAFLAVYLVSRWVSLPGLESLTGQWDLAPGTFALVFAAAFIAVHTTVLSGVNVAYPQRQQWYD